MEKNDIKKKIDFRVQNPLNVLCAADINVYYYLN